MTDIPSSPDPERPSVKVTYLERQKRKRKIIDGSDNMSDSESATSEIATSITISRALPKNMSTTSKKGPESKGPKKIEFNLPGPAPKRSRKDSEPDIATPSPSSKPLKKSLHSRASSSSLARVAQQVEAASASPSSKKPSSVASTRSVKRLPPRREATPDDEIDDGASVAASIADSTISVTAIRRTEEERLAYFRNQSDLGELEDHRAQCTRCGKYVALGKKRKYTVRPWEDHRKRCDATVPESSLQNAGTNQPNEEANADIAHPGEKPERKPTPERKEPLPSSRVATATRKLQIVNDPQAASFGPSHVDCVYCKEKIALGGEEAYNLTNWEAHKKIQCPNKPRPSPPRTGSVGFPVRPPPSSVSTEGTLVVPDSSSDTPSGKKRPREDPEVPVDDPDTRPSNRPRDETYEPPEKEVPGPMGWIMLPFKAFVRGFRDSLKTSS